MKILLAVDGSERSLRTTHHAIKTLRGCAGGEVHLLNVQPPADAPELLGHLPQAEVEAMQESRGGDAIGPARALLLDAGIACTPEVALGEIAETIVRRARETGCDGIVMGTKGLGSLTAALMGSVAADVLEITDMPVTFVK